MTVAPVSPETLAALPLLLGALLRAAAPAGRMRTLEPGFAAASLLPLLARSPSSIEAACGFALLVTVVCLASSLAGAVAAAPDPPRRAIRAAPLATAAFAILAVAARDPAPAIAWLGATSLSATVCLAAGQGSQSAQSCHLLARLNAIAIAIGLLGCLLAAASRTRAIAPPDAVLLRASADRLVPLACLALAGACPFGWSLAVPARLAPPHLAALALIVPPLAGDLLLVRTGTAFRAGGLSDGLAVMAGVAGLIGLLTLILPAAASRRGAGQVLPALFSLGLLALAGGGPDGVRALLVWLPVVALLGQALLLRPAAAPSRAQGAVIALAGLPVLFLLLGQAARAGLPVALACVALPLAIRPIGRPSVPTSPRPAPGRARTLLGGIAAVEILAALWLAVAMPRSLSDGLLDDAASFATGSAR